MQVLLDTHTLPWRLSDDPALPKSARKLIADTGNLILVSAESAWDIATKVGLGKLPAGADLVADLRVTCSGRPLKCWPFRGTMRFGPDHCPAHKDPFDRMLIVQAQAENIPILSNEACVAFGQSLSVNGRRPLRGLPATPDPKAGLSPSEEWRSGGSSRARPGLAR